MAISFDQLTRLELPIATNTEDGGFAELAVLRRLQVKVGKVLLRHMCAVRESEEREKTGKFGVSDGIWWVAELNNWAEIVMEVYE